jgi:PAS domain S-box-containing protein
VSSLIILRTVRVHAIDEALNKNSVISETINEKISLYLESAEKTIVTASNFSSHSLSDEQKIKEELSRIYDNYDYFDLIFYMDKEGKLIFSKPINENAIEHYEYTDRDYYQYIMENGEPYISRLYISRVLGQPHFVVAAPIFDENHNISGLIAAGIPLENIKNVIAYKERDFNGEFWVVDSYGALIVGPESAEALPEGEKIAYMTDNPVTIEGVNTSLYEVLANKRVGIGEVAKQGQMYYEAITYVANTGWMVMVEQSEDVILQDIQTIMDRLMSISIFTVIVSLFLGLLLAYSITLPIENLVSKVRKLSYGGYQPSLFTHQSNGEIGELYDAFKDMTVQLDNKVVELEASIKREFNLQQHLNNILMSAGSGVLAIDENDDITLFNHALENITGLSKRDYLHQSFETLSQAIKIDLEGIIAEYEKNNDNTANYEQVLIRNAQEPIHCRINISSVASAKGDVMGYVFLIQDTEKEKLLDEELKREDRISILGEFTSSIIHEIGNPLSGLSNLLELYRSDDVTLDEKEHILDLVEKELRDLNDIVLNYLNFARQNRSGSIVVDLGKIVDEAVNILKMELINNNISIRRRLDSEHIDIRVNRRGLKQTLINILKNSIQAIHGEGSIHITLRKRGEVAEIIIRDTGVGIPEADINNIFEPFYSTKQSGNGLGLSIAYKIIRDMDGEIAVESKLGVGTTFTISLPMA